MKAIDSTTIQNGYKKALRYLHILSFDENFDSQKIKRFLENLIPEGRGLEDILLFNRISKQKIFGIIKAIGQDTSGGLMFGKNENDGQAIFRPIGENELYERLFQIEEKVSLFGIKSKGFHSLVFKKNFQLFYKIQKLA